MNDTVTFQTLLKLAERDAAYCSPLIRKYSESLGHVPLIDHNPRSGEKIQFQPHQALRYRERSTVERVNARIKDDFGAHRIHVRGHAKVLAHLMFGVLALTAEQLMRWVT
jgi:transposase